MKPDGRQSANRLANTARYEGGVQFPGALHGSVETVVRRQHWTDAPHRREPLTDNTKTTAATVIPTMRYNDAAAAIAWLCEAFGFEKHLVVPGEDGTIVHAQLVFGNGMVMLGSARASEFDNLQKPPSALGGAVSQSPYIIVDDADKHYARAVAAGAEIVIEIKDEDYGGRDYSCRDPEGHVWNFGSYDPWASA
jgi:uncharacterized glyoxalase superfamily protein PhnB